MEHDAIERKLFAYWVALGKWKLRQRQRQIACCYCGYSLLTSGSA